MSTVNTILHPTDFSESAGAAFRLACPLAHDYGARLILLHSTRGRPPSARWPTGARLVTPSQPC